MFVLARNTALVPQPGRGIDRLLDESIARIFGTGDASSRSPALDVSETDHAYALALDLPGVSREQLKVSIHGRRVTIETVDVDKAETAGASADPSATPAKAAKPQAPRVLYRERATARYHRTVSLPAEVDQASSQAKLENGVLTLTLAKKVPTGAVQLSIA